MKQAEARRAQIKAVLDEPDGRTRSDSEIAAQIGCSTRLVASVRRANPTPEEMDRIMKGLDQIFSGIYEWHRDGRPMTGMGFQRAMETDE